MNEEEIVVQENKHVLPVFNKTIHDEDDSSEDENVIEIEPIHFKKLFTLHKKNTKSRSIQMFIKDLVSL